MDGVNTVEDQIERLDHAILASEDWAKSYKDQPEVLAKLIKAEAKLGRIVRRYFKTLAGERAKNFINWSIYQSKAVKGYSFDVMVDVTEINDEYNQLVSVIQTPLQEIMALGAINAENKYSIDLGLNKLSDSIMKTNGQYVAELVKGVTNTTKDRIKESIAASLRLGESIDQAVARLMEVIIDPRRAELISRTETVRAYSKGITLFGTESNATSKSWEISSDPCLICEGNADEGEIPFDHDFESGDSEPPAHPNCRCSISLTHSYE